MPNLLLVVLLPIEDDVELADAAANDRPRIALVSAGSITPSSHSLAEE